MYAEKQLNLAMPDEAGLKITDAPITVDKTVFLEVLGKLKTSESQAVLAAAVVALQRQLDSATPAFTASENTTDSAETLELGREFLFGELNQIAKAQTLERARYYLERLERGVTASKTGSTNDINLNQWKAYDDILTDSLWLIDRRDNTGVHSAGYWGNFVPQIPNQMLRRYTKPGEWVLDTFVGCGTTLIESQRLGRNALGIELQETVAQRASDFVTAEPNRQGVVSQIIAADSARLDYKTELEKHGQQSVQLVIMHPPYFDIIKFSDKPQDLSNAATVAEFLQMLKQVASNAATVLDKGRYLVLVIGDKYAKGEWVPLGFQAMNEIMSLGFSLKSIVVKNFEETAGKRQQKELWRYRALVGGFYIFKHEYIFILSKK